MIVDYFQSNRLSHAYYAKGGTGLRYMIMIRYTAGIYTGIVLQDIYHYGTFSHTYYTHEICLMRQKKKKQSARLHVATCQ